VTRSRIIVPGEPEPEPRQAPLLDTALVQREFLRMLKQKSAWDMQIKLAQLRASVIDLEEEQDEE